MPRNIETREGYEFWDRLCRLQRYSFFLGAGPSVRRVEDGTGNWIEVYGAQSVMDDAQSEINELREQNAKLAAKAQALREEVAALRARAVVPHGYALVPVEPTVAMRMPWKNMRGHSWYSKYRCMLEAAPRLNGKAVSEGLLRRLTVQPPAVCDIEDQWKWQREHDHALDELRDLLGEGKEVGDE